MTTDLTLDTTPPATPLDSQDTPNDITRAELIELARQTLDDRQFNLFQILHTPACLDGHVHLSGLCNLAGYTNVGQNACKIVREMFGKLERVGITRVRSFDVMVGFTPEKVKNGLGRLMGVENERVAVKAHDISSKIMGLQQSGAHVSVNVGVVVQVPRTVSEAVDRVIDADVTEDK